MIFLFDVQLRNKYDDDDALTVAYVAFRTACNEYSYQVWFDNVACSDAFTAWTFSNLLTLTTDTEDSVLIKCQVHNSSIKFANLMIIRIRLT